MHTGERKTEGGRVGEEAARGLSGCLRELGFELGRLKTGTPPRLARESIDFVELEEQAGDAQPVPFSEMTARGNDEGRMTNDEANSNDGMGEGSKPRAGEGTLAPPSQRAGVGGSIGAGEGGGRFPVLPQVPMHITHTNAKVHELIRANLHRAPMYSGQIKSRGPRYCPSIEDKIVRFADKESHQIFLEPEGLDTNEIYCNGISTSLPEDVQLEMVHAIKGLERAKILRWGYAVEYDFAPTHQVDATLETRLVEGLFFAGQLNGTSGYEEAAGQGLVAGINAARRVRGEGPFTLRRDQAYIGVMIDDLITKTPTEPYRMFTSRAEFRLMLRSDHADQRLTGLGAEMGLASGARVEKLARKMAAMGRVVEILRRVRLAVGDSGTTAFDFLRRPDVGVEGLRRELERGAARADEVGGLRGGLLDWRAIFAEPELLAVLGQVEIEAKYAGYIAREKEAAERMRTLEDKRIPGSFDFAGVGELRKEARQALEKYRPQTVGQASRLEGITPSDLTVLMIYLQGKKRA